MACSWLRAGELRSATVHGGRTHVPRGSFVRRSSCETEKRRNRPRLRRICSDGSFFVLSGDYYTTLVELLACLWTHKVPRFRAQPWGEVRESALLKLRSCTTPPRNILSFFFFIALGPRCLCVVNERTAGHEFNVLVLNNSLVCILACTTCCQ